MLNLSRVSHVCRLNSVLPNFVASRFRSSSANESLDGIALSDDKRTIVCWHPEKPFPYECSLPLPEAIAPQDHSVLKVQTTAALKHLYRPKTRELERQELMKLTYTTKHRWFPCSRKLKAKKTEMDRPYL